MVLDKSGSMGDMKRSVVTGYNEFLDTLGKEPAEVRVMRTMFSDDVTVEHEPVPIVAVERLTPQNYRTDGSTALYDGIGISIERLERVLRPGDKAVVVIMTDGDENFSQRWTREPLKQRIAEKQRAGWTFIFLGANTIDARAAGDALGIEAGNVLSFEATAAGIEKVFEIIAERTVLLLTDGS